MLFRSWRDIGDDDGDDLHKSPSRQGARTGTSVSQTRVLDVGRAVNRIWENPSGVLRFGDEGVQIPKGTLGVVPGPQGASRCSQGGGRGWCPPEGPVAPPLVALLAPGVFRGEIILGIF